MSQLTKTLEINANSKFIRFYLWLYDADKQSITTCKLWWGTILAIPAMIVFSVLWLGSKLIMPLADRMEARRSHRREKARNVVLVYSEKAINPEPESPRESKLTKFATAFSVALAKHKRKFAYLGWGLFVAATLGLLYFLYWMLTSHTHTSLVLLLGIGASSIALLILFGIIYCIANLIEKRELRKRRMPPKPAKDNPGFFEIMKHLYHDFHNNTCARVMIKEEE